MFVHTFFKISRTHWKQRYMCFFYWDALGGMWLCIFQVITEQILNDKLTAEDHVALILTSSSSSLYALWVLHDHGLPAISLQDVFCAMIRANDTLLCPGMVRPLLGKSSSSSSRMRVINHNWFARRVIVKDWMHSNDVARNMATVLMMFRQWLMISLPQLTSHCSSEFSTTNFTCSSRCCLTRLSIVINYTRANTTDN